MKFGLRLADGDHLAEPFPPQVVIGLLDAHLQQPYKTILEVNKKVLQQSLKLLVRNALRKACYLIVVAGLFGVVVDSTAGLGHLRPQAYEVHPFKHKGLVLERVPDPELCVFPAGDGLVIVQVVEKGLSHGLFQSEKPSVEDTPVDQTQSKFLCVFRLDLRHVYQVILVLKLFQLESFYQRQQESQTSLGGVQSG